jgi:hypothetical protein
VSQASNGAVPAPTITSRDAAEALLTAFDAAADELGAVFAKETELMRGGRLGDATALAVRKAAAIASFTALAATARREVAALDRFAPAATLALRRRQTALRTEVKTNLAVLATARDVAEGLVRAVADALGAVAAPSAYGATGTAPKGAIAARGLALDRSL